MEVYIKQVLSADFDINGSDELVEASKVLVMKMAALGYKQTGNIWTLLPRLVPVQKFVVDVIRFLGDLYKDATLLEKCQQIPLYKGLKGGGNVSIAWTWTHFWRFIRQLREVW